MKLYELKNVYFVHMHTKFQLSSFIRSGDIADSHLGVFFSKMPFFQKNAVFMYKSKSAISLLLLKLESWNLVCICKKCIFLVACYATLHPALSVRPSVGPSVRRSVRPSHFTFFGFLGFLAWLLLPKWSGNLNYGPCPPARDWGSRVSGLVLFLRAM